MSKNTGKQQVKVRPSDELAKAKKKDHIELTENELDKASGGDSFSFGAANAAITVKQKVID